MDVLKEMKEIREMNALVGQLTQRGADPIELRLKMRMPSKPGESDLAYQARILTYSYASDFLEAAESKGITLTFQPDEVDAIGQAVGAAYEVNRASRGMEHKENQVLVSKELGCYLALVLCNAREGKMKVQMVPVTPMSGLTSMLVNGMTMTVALPKFREINPIEVANRVVKSIRVSDSGLTYKQGPIANALK